MEKGAGLYRVSGPNVRNFKITLEYDGSRYCGWQRQSNAPTIQGEIEKALRTMVGQKISIVGSGRTDAGVHAYAQVANFHCDTKLGPQQLKGGLTSLTPEDIVVTNCEEVDNTFHARYDAKSKEYIYKILNRPNPAAIFRQYTWHIRAELNLEAMRSAITCLIGRHDFRAFEAAGGQRSHAIRCVLMANLIEADNGYLLFEIEADGFLRFMVRNIVGTLIEVGLGKITPADFKRILDSKERFQAGATAPARGLFLKQVNY